MDDGFVARLYQEKRQDAARRLALARRGWHSYEVKMNNKHIGSSFDDSWKKKVS